MSDDFSKIHFKATRQEMKEARAAFDSNHDGIVTIEEVAKNTQKALDVFKKNIDANNPVLEGFEDKEKAISGIAEIELIKTAKRFGVDLTDEKLIKKVEAVQGHNSDLTPHYSEAKKSGKDLQSDKELFFVNLVLDKIRNTPETTNALASGEKQKIKLEFVDIGANGSLVGKAATTPKKEGDKTPSSYLA